MPALFKYCHRKHLTGVLPIEYARQAQPMGRLSTLPRRLSSSLRNVSKPTENPLSTPLTGFILCLVFYNEISFSVRKIFPRLWISRRSIPPGCWQRRPSLGQRSLLLDLANTANLTSTRCQRRRWYREIFRLSVIFFQRNGRRNSKRWRSQWINSEQNCLVN